MQSGQAAKEPPTEATPFAQAMDFYRQRQFAKALGKFKEATEQWGPSIERLAGSTSAHAAPTGGCGNLGGQSAAVR